MKGNTFDAMSDAIDSAGVSILDSPSVAIRRWQSTGASLVRVRRGGKRDDGEEARGEDKGEARHASRRRGASARPPASPQLPWRFASASRPCAEGVAQVRRRAAAALLVVLSCPPAAILKRTMACGATQRRRRKLRQMSDPLPLSRPSVRRVASGAQKRRGCCPRMRSGAKSWHRCRARPPNSHGMSFAPMTCVALIGANTASSLAMVSSSSAPLSSRSSPW